MIIDGFNVSPGQPPFIIAEMASSHGGDFARALALIEAAKNVGADAIKLQYYTPDSITLDCDKPNFILKDGPWKGRKLYDLYKEAATPVEWFPALMDHARNMEITCFSSVFDAEGFFALQKLDAPAYKISSFDIQDTQLIKLIVGSGKPIIISTGMAEWEDILIADDVIPPEYPHAFLHCVSGYPTPTDEANLSELSHLMGLGLPTGLSDHSMDTTASVMAVALGACIIEKHIKLDGDETSPDAHFSLTPKEFAKHVSTLRQAYRAMEVVPKQSEHASHQARKSIYFVRDVLPETPITSDDIRSVRPSGGLAPHLYPLILGRTVRRPVSRGTPLAWDDLQELS